MAIFQVQLDYLVAPLILNLQTSYCQHLHWTEGNSIPTAVQGTLGYALRSLPTYVTNALSVTQPTASTHLKDYQTARNKQCNYLIATSVPECSV